ncbi:unnamed protein product [Gongylonema pulchrum]|uniref:Uncharacterized protein n=1 Tax=Gongylonema pulchrum TaxID=637853 RepID=A0A183E9Z4_9BILA|nr:unnamed protein product [Gongylonema pulchrum]
MWNEKKMNFKLKKQVFFGRIKFFYVLKQNTIGIFVGTLIDIAMIIVPFEGCYRQVGTTLVITEYSGAAAASASKIDDSQTHPIGLEPIERLIFIKQQQQCSYCWFFPKRTGESNESTSSSNLENDQDPHFFCLRSSTETSSSGSNGGILDVDRLMQRTIFLPTAADFTTNRILQHVPMNLMNGTSAIQAPTSNTIGWCLLKFTIRGLLRALFCVVHLPY